MASGDLSRQRYRDMARAGALITHMPTLPGAAELTQHLLVFSMIVIAPVWDRIATRDLKTSTDPNVKRRYYRITSIVRWTASVVACLAVGGYLPLAHITRMSDDAPWLPSAQRSAQFLQGALIGALLVWLVPAALAIWIPTVREKSAKAFKSLAFFLPTTPKERAWWAIVSVTAGVCEEIIFRGFLLRYLHTAPWHLTLIWAIALSSAIFGLQHLYQGIAGVLQTTVMGVLFCLIFLITGNLAVPILLHTVMDLRVLLLLPPTPTST
jgi:membrane protease YdiL (CAAX protease family)